MFLETTIERNPNLLQRAILLHKSGKIRPDTWVIDLDTLTENAQKILAEAKKHGIELYYMTKQIGRNPIIASRLEELGYAGAVVVDYKEAQLFAAKNLRLGHVGHLVQIPDAQIPEILAAKPQIITVYSTEKAERISDEAKKKSIVQPVMLRIADEGGMMYPGQEGGFPLSEIEHVAEKIKKMPGIRLAGLTAFPCFLFDEKAGDFAKTGNVDLLMRAKKILDHSDLQINMPASTCVRTIPMIAAALGTHGEPGHALTGTTYMHAHDKTLAEVPAMIYITEVSHHTKNSSMVFGGGFYRRGHLKNALVNGKITTVVPPDNMSIDYHFEIDGKFPIGATVAMAFRTQIFVTRSDVAVIGRGGEIIL